MGNPGKCRRTLSNSYQHSWNPQFAHFDARLEPSSGHDGIRVATNWVDATDNKWLEAIERGVDQFVMERREADRPICNTTLVMLRVISHPVVTNEATVSSNVTKTLMTYFDHHESMVSVDWD
jgi:hypothetical protein